jgi:hypothetical protein
MRLYDEPWKRCGSNLCLRPSEAQKSLNNKIEMLRYVRESNVLMDYYERRDPQHPTFTVPAPSSR